MKALRGERSSVSPALCRMGPVQRRRRGRTWSLRRPGPVLSPGGGLGASLGARGALKRQTRASVALFSIRWNFVDRDLLLFQSAVHEVPLQSWPFGGGMGMRDVPCRLLVCPVPFLLSIFSQMCLNWLCQFSSRAKCGIDARRLLPLS